MLVYINVKMLKNLHDNDVHRGELNKLFFRTHMMPASSFQGHVLSWNREPKESYASNRQFILCLDVPLSMH